ncbi:hypothetical protein [Sedimenticola hydrogenitrophicus]|uniref:hypothetical protein n=1 Tax=Sedimenticola hydrogenitrophicus TaxID=2967975 RepID=UPI0021A82E41|nr:hypothetical protein [Sedimenticola hydrogenitrophicus]
MGRIHGSEHIGSKTLVGLVMLVTASTTAMGTTQNTRSLAAGNGLPAITSHLQEQAVVENKATSARLPSCTPGFICNAPVNQAVRVSHREALQFALLLGSSPSR